jgi:competence protein ComEC
LRSPFLALRIPAPVALWIALLAGHALVAGAPLPSAWEEAARLTACAAGAVSLLAAWGGSRHRARVRASVFLARAEVLAGIVALVAAGGALAGEADRSETPLPVHPRPVPVVVEGRVLDAVATDAALPTITLGADSIGVGDARAGCDATLLVRFGEDGPAPAWATPGISIRFQGRYRPLEDARNPGSTAPGRWQGRLGIAGSVDADPTSVVVLAGARDDEVPWSGLLRLRLARLFARDLSAPVAALARGMALGDRSGISPQVNDAFRNGGTIHILSISGLHVCVLAGIVAAMAVAFRLPAGPALWLWLELFSLWGYVLLVGAPASAVRSAILWSAMRAGRMRGAPVRPFAAWGLAGLLIHLAIPTALEDPGFQLSFAAVLGLLASGGLRLTLPAGRMSALGAGLLSLAQQSAFAEAGTLGIQVLQFGAVPVAGLFLNLAVIPLCSAFMAAMLVQLGCAALAPALLPAASGAVEVSGLLMLKLTAAVARAVPPVPVRALPSPALLVGCAALLLLAASVWEHARVERRAPDRRAARWCALAALLLAWAAPFLPVPRAPDRASWILMLDVGQGDGTVAHAPGATLLVDAGPSTETRDEGRVTLEPALRAERITRVDAAILSHAHRDHYGGLGWLAGRGFQRALFENGSDPRGSWRGPVRAGLRASGARDVAVLRDTVLALAGSEVALARVSDTGAAAARPGNAHENNRSLVARLELGGSTVCFAGDVEHDAEMELLGRGSLGPVSILKVPHHGSRTSSDSAWVATLRPRVALISCGERNRFGHPDRATVGRYLRSGARLYRTDREGAIRVTVVRGGAWVSTRAHPAPEWVRWDGGSALTPSGQSP